MPTFNDELRAAQAVATGVELEPVWLPAHYAWMARPFWERMPTQASMDHTMRARSGADIPKRVGDQVHRFSASSVGGEHGEGFNCHRAVLFHYVGAPKIAPDLQAQDNMDQGNALHLHYQCEGLDAGYITSCETWDWAPQLRYGGKDDGILLDGSLLELKFVNGKKFHNIVNGNRQFAQMPGPLLSHRLQITGLMLLKGIVETSLVYSNKETGEFKEYREPLNQAMVDLFYRLLDDLNGWVGINELPGILEGCATSHGWLAANCEYRDICPSAHSILESVYL